MKLQFLSIRDALILTAAAALWVPGFRGMYFLSDDFTHLEVWGVTPLSDVGQWFFREYTGFYRPFTALLWNAYHSLWGMAPIGYRVSNLALHLACATMVATLAGSLFANRRAGLVAGLVFLFQAGHVFAVLNIANLTGLLCAAFVLASLLFYLRGRSGDRTARLLSLCAFAGGLLTKELALCVPLVVAVWEALLILSNGERALRRWLRQMWPFAAVLGAYLLFRLVQFGHLSHSPLGHSNLAPVNLLLNFSAYTAAAIFPWGLEGLKPVVRAYPFVFSTAGGVVTAAALAAVWKWRQRLSVAHVICLALMFVSMLPVVRLFSPWNAYLPTAGSAMLVGGLLAGETGHFKLDLRAAAATLIVALGVTFSLGHQREWQRAGNAGRALLNEVESELCGREGRFYLANLPVEFGSVPVFGGDWGFLSGLQLRGCRAEVIPLAAVHQENSEGLVLADVDGGSLSIKLHGGDFFRLYTTEVLSKRVAAGVGYSYEVYGSEVAVVGAGSHGQPNHITVQLGPQYWDRVFVWEAGELRQIAGGG